MVIRQLQNFPIYLLGASNTMIGKIMASAFKSTSMPAWIKLFWVHELQRSELEVVLQNMLAQEPGAMTSGLIETMQHKLVDYNKIVMFLNSTAIALSLWERAFQRQYHQMTDKWTTQLIDYELKATLTFEPGELLE